MSIEQKIEMLEEVMDLDAGELSPEMVLEDIDDYTSMAKLSLIVMMADEFSKTLTSDDIKKFVTVQDIIDCMN